VKKSGYEASMSLFAWKLNPSRVFEGEVKKVYEIPLVIVNKIYRSTK
jgi:hypothetical protein